MSRVGVPIPNQILAALPEGEYERIRPRLFREDWPSGKLLFHSGEMLSHVYFINSGMASLVSLTDEGSSIEVGVIGHEGMLGVSAVLGSYKMAQSAVVQLPGEALRLDVNSLTAELNGPGLLQGLLMRQMYLLHAQVARSVLCNRFHRVEARLCRWLLMCLDRTDSDEIPLTQEFLAMMLGVARPIVSEAAGSLQKRGLIEYRPGRITIVDRERVLATACDCYEVVRRQSEEFPD